MLLSARCGLTGYRWLYPSPSRKVSISSSLGGSSPKKWLNFLKLVVEPLRKGPLESLLALCEGEEWEGGRVIAHRMIRNVCSKQMSNGHTDLNTV